jgi:gp16 family phage-associated protein
MTKDNTLNEVRAGLILQGTTLKEYCRRTGLNHGNVYKALQGQWNGPKGQALRDRLMLVANGHLDR